MPGPYLNSGVYSTRVTDNDTSQKEELGVLRFEGGKLYRYVKSGALIAAYSALKLDVSASTAAAAMTQAVQTSTDTDMFFGVNEVTMALNSFGWITVYGPATARVTTGIVPGVALGTTNTTGILGIRQISHFSAAGLAVASGLSAGSPIFISVL